MTSQTDVTYDSLLQQVKDACEGGTPLSDAVWDVVCAATNDDVAFEALKSKLSEVAREYPRYSERSRDAVVRGSIMTELSIRIAQQVPKFVNEALDELDANPSFETHLLVLHDERDKVNFMGIPIVAVAGYHKAFKRGVEFAVRAAANDDQEHLRELTEDYTNDFGLATAISGEALRKNYLVAVYQVCTIESVEETNLYDGLVE